jgi:hypothetical protein
MASFQQFLSSILHQQCMTIVDGIAQLEGKNAVTFSFQEQFAQLSRCFPEFVQPISIGDPIEDLWKNFVKFKNV